jgi:hypothetical protein
MANEVNVFNKNIDNMDKNISWIELQNIIDRIAQSINNINTFKKMYSGEIIKIETKNIVLDTLAK